jgi:hypothetical protein
MATQTRTAINHTIYMSESNRASAATADGHDHSDILSATLPQDAGGHMTSGTCASVVASMRPPTRLPQLSPLTFLCRVAQCSMTGIEGNAKAKRSTRPGIEPGSPAWKANVITIRLPGLWSFVDVHNLPFMLNIYMFLKGKCQFARCVDTLQPNTLCATKHAARWSTVKRAIASETMPTTSFVMDD